MKSFEGMSSGNPTNWFRVQATSAATLKTNVERAIRLLHGESVAIQWSSVEGYHQCVMRGSTQPGYVLQTFTYKEIKDASYTKANRNSQRSNRVGVSGKRRSQSETRSLGIA
jgi:hypothetical protein